MAVKRVHQAQQYRAGVPGVTPMAFASNHHFPRHSHDQFGVGLVTAGGHRSWSASGAVMAMPGDVIMVNPGEIHDGAPVNGSVREWRIIYLTPELVAKETGEDFRGTREIVRAVATDAVLASKVRLLFNAFDGDALDVEERIVSTIVCLFRRHGAATFRDSRMTAPVRTAVREIEAAPERQVTLAGLAALSGVSRFQLLRAFSREIGITPYAFVLQSRVRLAERLLQAGRSPADAALDAGFSDQSHLTRAFGRQVGITPHQYRMAQYRARQVSVIRRIVSA